MINNAYAYILPKEWEEGTCSLLNKMLDFVGWKQKVEDDYYDDEEDVYDEEMKTVNLYMAKE